MAHLPVMPRSPNDHTAGGASTSCGLFDPNRTAHSRGFATGLSDLLRDYRSGLGLQYSLRVLWSEAELKPALPAVDEHGLMLQGRDLDDGRHRLSLTKGADPAYM